MAIEFMEKGFEANIESCLMQWSFAQLILMDTHKR